MVGEEEEEEGFQGITIRNILFSVFYVYELILSSHLMYEVLFLHRRKLRHSSAITCPAHMVTSSRGRQ